jgi:hypothetical protein
MEFKLDDIDKLDKKELVEDLRDQMEIVTTLYEDLDKEIIAYNKIVIRAEKFVRGLIEDNEDSLESRTERFQASKRGQEIAMWINELREFVKAAKVIQLPCIEELDPDYEGVATQLEDLSEGA